MKAPGGPQISLTCREEAFHQPSFHQQQACVLGSLPEPEGGISWGWRILCPSQTKELQKGATASLQESRQASGMERFLHIPGQGFPGAL